MPSDTVIQKKRKRVTGENKQTPEAGADLFGLSPAKHDVPTHDRNSRAALPSPQSVDPGAPPPDLPLRAGLDGDAAHPHHGLGELVGEAEPEQAPDVAGVPLHGALRRGVAPQPLVRLQHGVAVPDVLEEGHVERAGAVLVQRHPPPRVAVRRAQRPELRQERRADARVRVARRREVEQAVAEELAVRLPDGVGTCSNNSSSLHRQ